MGQQLRKLESARMYFRYPGVDGDGCRCDLCRANEAIHHRAHRIKASGYEDKPKVLDTFAIWSLQRQKQWARA